MVISRPVLIMGLGIALIGASIALRVAFGASLSQATATGSSTMVVWAGTIVLFVAGFYLLLAGAKRRKSARGETETRIRRSN